MTPRAYYNEIEPFAVEWLHNLMLAGLIMDGEVDSRSIVEVKPDDLKGFTRCHFFAGIGGWDLALQLAQWPDDRPVWTGSCPCQPFSVAGKGAGTADDRHLWPEWFRLIRECRPGVVFGEQVEAAIRHGWLDAVQADLEGIGYAVGAVGLPAAGFGAPHIRQRLWFVADANEAGRCVERSSRLSDGEQAQRDDADGRGADDWLGNTDDARLEGHGRYVALSDAQGRQDAERHEPAHSFWSAADWIACRDGKARPVEPGTFPLAHGVSNRVGRLRAYGNAIVPQVAADLIKAYMECRP